MIDCIRIFENHDKPELERQFRAFTRNPRLAVISIQSHVTADQDGRFWYCVVVAYRELVSP